MISEELYRRYNVGVDMDELGRLHTFLIVTDHIPNKIIEAQAMGETPPDYTEILSARAEARKRINELRRENSA